MCTSRCVHTCALHGDLHGTAFKGPCMAFMFFMCAWARVFVCVTPLLTARHLLAAPGQYVYVAR